MRYATVDGVIFAKMMRNALNNLRLHEDEINKLNVFPVPDGDTGTNMRRTVEMGVEAAPDTKDLCEYLKGLSAGMLLGARGNSGVILSQIFKGFAGALSRAKAAATTNLVTAFVKGYIAAYAAVIRPVEGTILTVVREGIESVRKQAYKKASIETMLSIFITEMKKTLNNTPEMLPILKEAGVVDSGGYGFVLIVEGMLKALYDEVISANEDNYAPTNVAENTVVDTDSFGVNTKFDFGYCMEFTLQLMNKKRPVKNFNLEYFIDDMKPFGDSLVAFLVETRVRVHIHTFRPEKIISFCRQYGEFVFFKLENMQLQHNEFVEAKKTETQQLPHKKFAVLAVADGNGIAETFKGLGCDVVINGGKTMSTSVKEFLDAFEQANADIIAVLPNDKNIVNSALQAAQLYNGKVEVLPSKSMVEGYFALASNIPDSSPNESLAEMKKGLSGVTTLYVSRATLDRNVSGVECKAGDFLAFVDGKLVCSCADITTTTVQALRSVKGISDKEQALVFTGLNIQLPEDFEGKISDVFPDIQLELVDGGETGCLLIIGII